MNRCLLASSFSHFCNENGSRKYEKLWILVKCVMLISHGNADPEREFSINKHILKMDSALMKKRRGNPYVKGLHY